MQAETLVQVDSLMNIVIAPLAATLIAIGKSKGNSIVAGRYHSLVFCDDRTNATLHAVRA